MATYLVKFEAQTDIEVEAENASQAAAMARRQLNPDVDWDFKDIEELGA